MKPTVDDVDARLRGYYVDGGGVMGDSIIRYETLY